MSRSLELYFLDILTGIDKIRLYLQDVDRESFETNGMLVDAILFNLITVGEAVKQISEDLLSKYPNVRWHDIARFRDRTAHHYYSLDLNIVWDIVQNYLQPCTMLLWNFSRRMPNKMNDVCIALT